MPEERLSVDQAVRLLRAKAAELENELRAKEDRIGYLAADIALVATILADHMERAPHISHRG